MFRIGQTVSYVLSPKDKPVNPLKEYTGVIIDIKGNQLRVRLTEPPYEGLEEWINEAQVRSIGKQNGEQRS
jgi:hypothetical protein